MASLPQRETETERETQPESGGVFIRYATINDIDEIKTRLDRQDVRMDRQDAKLDTLIVEVADLKARQTNSEARLDRMEDRMDHIDDKLDKINARLIGFMIALFIAVVVTLIRSFF